MGASGCAGISMRNIRARFFIPSTADAEVANRIARIFDASPAFEVAKAKRKHRQFEVQRERATK